MTWHDEWASLSARISGFGAAAAFFFANTEDQDNYGMSSELVQTAWSIIDALTIFRHQHATSLPGTAVARIDQAIARSARFVDAKETRVNSGRPAAYTLTTFLHTVRGELDFLLSDREVVLRGIAERAFLHLQRLIVVDAEVRGKWTAAFGAGEIGCERLGGAQLLQHGLYAFKSYAAGERTDLILGEKLVVDNRLRQAVEALVLTEWKVVRKPGELAKKHGEALQEAKRYGDGSLAGFELHSVRFVVTVSESVHTPLADIVDGTTIYRHVNIAVAPSSPSVDASKANATAPP